MVAPPDVSYPFRFTAARLLEPMKTDPALPAVGWLELL